MNNKQLSSKHVIREAGALLEEFLRAHEAFTKKTGALVDAIHRDIARGKQAFARADRDLRHSEARAAEDIDQAIFEYLSDEE